MRSDFAHDDEAGNFLCRSANATLRPAGSKVVSAPAPNPALIPQRASAPRERTGLTSVAPTALSA